jgi:hypothetical protein
MHAITSRTHDSPAVFTTVDTGIFPLPIIQYALYTLSDTLEGQIVSQADGKVIVKLAPLTALTEQEITRAWNQTLLTTSVNEHAFQVSAPIRNHLAQTVLSITTQTQQTITEFVADQISQRDVEHAGAPPHIDVAITPAKETSPPPLQAVKMDAQAGSVDIALDTRRYLLPDVLWAVHHVRGACAEFVLNQSGKSLITRLQRQEPAVELESLIEQFKHWLGIAVVRDGRKDSNV